MTTKEITEKLLLEKFAGARKDALGQLASVIALQSDTEEEVRAAVEKLTDEKVNAFTKEYRSGVDREVTAARKKIMDGLTSQKSARSETDTQKAEGDTITDNTDITALIAKAIAEATQPLREQVETLSRANVGKNRLERLNEALKDCKDDTLRTSTLRNYNRMAFEGDDAFDTFLKETKSDVQQANQNLADASLSNFKSPFKASDKSTAEEDFVEAMKAINKPKD
jgi:CHAD domain-containing protein